MSNDSESAAEPLSPGGEAEASGGVRKPGTVIDPAAGSRRILSGEDVAVPLHVRVSGAYGAGLVSFGPIPEAAGGDEDSLDAYLDYVQRGAAEQRAAMRRLLLSLVSAS